MLGLRVRRSSRNLLLIRRRTVVQCGPLAAKIVSASLIGVLDEARLAFEKMLTYANRVGLYAEQISRAGQQQGNFPRH